MFRNTVIVTKGGLYWAAIDVGGDIDDVPRRRRLSGSVIERELARAVMAMSGFAGAFATRRRGVRVGPADQQSRSQAASARDAARLRPSQVRPSASIQRQCAECAEDEKGRALQAKSAPSGRVPAARWRPSAVLGVVGRGGGHPLAPDVQADMEARFGADFSDVRIHTDAKAASSAAAVAAEAYTLGNEIVFGHASFAPDSPEGQRTLAHELAHVQQQRQGPVSGTPADGGVAVSDPSDSFERQAEATARAVMARPRPLARNTAAAADYGTSRFSAACVQRADDLDADVQGAGGQAGTDSGLAGANTPMSCAGWESDPQSFSKRIAENFAQDAFRTSLSAPDSISCAGNTCLVHYGQGQVVPFDITVDLSQVPGIVSASGTAVPVLLRPQRCSYSYSCDFSGSISFTRLNCRFI